MSEWDRAGGAPRLLLVLALVLVHGGTASADNGSEVVIPCTDRDWEIDGAICDAEKAASAQFPTAESLPLSARSMRCDDDLYLGIEVEGAWDEVFAFCDNGDGSLYDAGDTIFRCNPQGCEQWEYVGLYDFEAVCQLPSAVSDGAVEFELPMECVMEGEGALVVGVVCDEAELTSDPIDVSFGECAVDAPPLTTDTPLASQPVASAATATPPGEGGEVATQPVGEDQDGIGGLLLPALGALALVGLLGLLFWLLGVRRKKPDPCEEWWENCVESMPDGYERGARARCDNGRKPRVDPKAQRISSLEKGIRELEEMPQSEERDQAIERLKDDLWFARQMADSVDVLDSAGADLSATYKGVPEGAPCEVKWEVDTREGRKTFASGTKARLSPEQLKEYAAGSPVKNVVRVYVAVTVCPGTPQEKTFYSPLLQITPLFQSAWELGEMKWE
jgi:hypothetical protein